MEVETKLVVDASPYGLGAVLLQRRGNDMYPVAYASRTLNEVEKRYAHFEREALAVLFGLQKMHTYVYGRHTTVATDHKPLLSIFTKSTQSIRLERIAMRAQDYDFTLTYEPGAENVADGWSRLPAETTESTGKFIEEHVQFVARDIDLMTLQEIREEGKVDAELQMVVNAINNGWRNTEDVVKKWQHLSNELSYAQEAEVELNIEKRYERYQKKMCEYANEKRGAKQHDLSVGDVVFVASMTSSKLNARYPEDRYVILRKKGIDTFEVVQVDTGKVFVRNAKFLTKAPQKRDMQLNDDVADGGDKIGTADSVVTPRSDAIRASDTIVSEGHCDGIAETATPYEQTESREENLEMRAFNAFVKAK
ncbi:hypothetical protein QZH41_000200 [Actinostola sp. cb2023]|nr:hypothetical protein QZH41_000200 [Actinostola sp. cb2023]